MNLPNKKAIKLEQIDSVLQFNAPLPGKEHPFYTDFTGLRGDFKEKKLYRTLNLNPSNLTYNYEANQFNKLKVFLAGMRGSGKTTELARIVEEIEHKDGFLCVVCNIDIELNMDHVDYMDILICQIENLIKKAQEKGVQLDKNIVKSLSKWFEERTVEINSSLEISAGIEFELEGKWGLPWLLSLVGKLKGGLTGSKEKADSVRKVFRNRFVDFAQEFNIFVEDAARWFRDHSEARDILFIIDGLEKTTTAERRREIIIENAESIKSIRANWLMTLPIELMKSIRQVKDYSEVITFPFIKIQEIDGSDVEATINRFIEFVYRRIDASLFESEEVVKTAVRFSGGSPRELLRLLQHAGYELEDNDTQITMKALMEAVRDLSADARFLSDKELVVLKEIRKNNQGNKPTPFIDGIEKLLEEIVVMEYNSGTYKRVNPIIAYSSIYQEYVGKD